MLVGGARVEAVVRIGVVDAHPHHRRDHRDARLDRLGRRCATALPLVAVDLEGAGRLELGEQPGLTLADRPAAIDQDLWVGRLAAAKRDPQPVGASVTTLHDEGDLVARGEVEQRRVECEPAATAGDDRCSRGRHRGRWGRKQDRWVVKVGWIASAPKPRERHIARDEGEFHDPEEDVETHREARFRHLFLVTTLHSQDSRRPNACAILPRRTRRSLDHARRRISHLE